MIDMELHSLTLHRRDVAPYEIFPVKETDADRCQQDALFQRAREGDVAARDTLLLSLQRYLRVWASRFIGSYQWENQTLEVMELVSVGNVTLFECFERALTKERPYVYLASVARWSMRQYCLSHGTCITTPQGHKPHVVTSLDLPFSNGEGARGDLLADPCWQSPDEETTRQQETLYEQLSHALPLLTPRQREIMIRMYGIGEYAPEGREQIGRTLFPPVGRDTVASLHDGACHRLRQLLTNAPMDAQGNPQLYTLAEALQVLGVNAGNFRRLMSELQIKPCSRGWYARKEIDALAEQRAAMVAKRKHLQQLDPQERGRRTLDLQQVRSKRYRARKRAQREQEEGCA